MVRRMTAEEKGRGKPFSIPLFTCGAPTGEKAEKGPSLDSTLEERKKGTLFSLEGCGGRVLTKRKRRGRRGNTSDYAL